MKEKIKKVYMSENGIEFETKLECVLYECDKKIGTDFGAASIHIISKFIMDCKEEILKVLSEDEGYWDVVKKLGFKEEYISLNTGDIIKEGDEFLNGSKWKTTHKLSIGKLVAWDDIYRRKKPDYYYLKSYDIIKEGDEFFDDPTGKWTGIDQSDVGEQVGIKYRRKL